MERDAEISHGERECQGYCGTFRVMNLDEGVYERWVGIKYTSEFQQPCTNAIASLRKSMDAGNQGAGLANLAAFNRNVELELFDFYG